MVFHNPNEGSFVVELPNDQLGGNYSIMDINGKILEQGIFTDAMNKSFTLPKGLYYFHWHFNGNINVQKIVVL